MDEEEARDLAERPQREPVANAVVDDGGDIAVLLEQVGVFPEGIGPLTWVSTKRNGGSQVSIRVCQRTGTPCSLSL